MSKREYGDRSGQGDGHCPSHSKQGTSEANTNQRMNIEKSSGGRSTFDAEQGPRSEGESTPAKPAN